jgi:hypothetical protein
VEEPARPRAKRRTAWIVAALVLVAILVAAFWLLIPLRFS